MFILFDHVHDDRLVKCSHKISVSYKILEQEHRLTNSSSCADTTLHTYRW